MNTIPVLTDTIPVRPDSNYTSYAGIYRFEPSYKLVGGINAPKRTECIGTDGVKRAQLIKGMSNDFSLCYTTFLFWLIFINLK